MGKEKFHTRVYLLLYGYVQKKCTWNPFLRSHENLHSLLTSIMKMLFHSLTRTISFKNSIREAPHLLSGYNPLSLQYLNVQNKNIIQSFHRNVRNYNTKSFLFVMKMMFQSWYDQQKSGKLLSRVPTARRANSVFIILFSLWKWYATLNVRASSMIGVEAFFRWIYSYPTHAKGFTHFFAGLIPIYKSFSLWKQHNAILIMEIILLLLGDKWGDSGQHGWFSLGFIQSTSSSHPINSSWKQRTTSTSNSNYH